MKKKYLILSLLVGFVFQTKAQDKIWTMEECMKYAMENSPAVRQKVHTDNTYKAEYVSSIGSFFPSVGASSSIEWRYGRSITQDNTYDNVSNLNNDYRLSTNIPVFTGGQLINEWRRAKVNRQLGKNDIQKTKDDLALKVLEAYVNVVYYEGMVRFSAEKLEESERTLYLTRRKEELGLMGKADVIQIEAQVASDDYIHTFNGNKYTTALLTLKEYMNYPYDQELVVDTLTAEVNYIPSPESIEDIFLYASESNPTALGTMYELKAAKMNHLIEKGKLFPTISFAAGVNTNYYKDLNFEKTPEMKPEDLPKSFSTQFKNNRGEYFGFSISIPLFNRLNTITNIKRARNNVRIAQEQQFEALRQLETAIEKAVTDRNGYAKEAIHLEKKKQSEEYSYQVTLRKFEEGLMSPLDLQTSSNILLESRANLLQRKLLFLIKTKEVDYYKGIPLVD